VAATRPYVSQVRFHRFAHSNHFTYFVRVRVRYITNGYSRCSLVNVSARVRRACVFRAGVFSDRIGIASRPYAGKIFANDSSTTTAVSSTLHRAIPMPFITTCRRRALPATRPRAPRYVSARYFSRQIFRWSPAQLRFRAHVPRQIPTRFPIAPNFPSPSSSPVPSVPLSVDSVRICVGSPAHARHAFRNRILPVTFGPAELMFERNRFNTVIVARGRDITIVRFLERLR